jgi:penicillin amidase
MRFISIALAFFLLTVPAFGQGKLDEQAKAVLAQLDGEIRLAGLKEPVEVLRDRWGIPHIYAKNRDDLFFAQGFIAAQDRLFQLDLWRRIGVGETAEIVGAEAIEADAFARLIRYRGEMGQEWTSYSPDTREIATAFTRGINACIDHSGDRLPIEFQLLGYRPKKWQPEDVLARMSGIIMSRNFSDEVVRAMLIDRLGLEKVRALCPTDPHRDFAPAAGLELSGIDRSVLKGYLAASKSLQFKPSRTESNNWVVSGERSKSGKPLLANDPHRAIALPALRYLVHLNAPGWNVIGSGEPGLPGVAIGHNERIAWGFTTIGTDQADLFVEELHPDDATLYRVGKDWQKMLVVKEHVPVKGKAEPAEVSLRFTRHGPVIHQDVKSRRAYALKWAGSEPGGAAYLRSLAVGRSQNQRDFVDAMAAWKIPSLNIVYADVDGNIGWVAAALTPIRPKHDGLLPVPGNGGYEWAGYLGVKDLPQTFNPKSGWIATANHNIIPEGYRHQIGYEFAAPYRFERVKHNLEAKPKLDLVDFQAIQHDNVSIPGQKLAKLLAGTKFSDPTVERYAQILRGWDGKLSKDSQAGPIYALWLPALQEAVYSSHAPKELVKDLTAKSGLPAMLRALEEPDEKWFGKQPVAERDRLVRTTFERAVGELLRRWPQSKQIGWGAIHTATFRHPLGIKGFDVGPFERTGDANTPNNTRHDDNFQQVHGATYRHLFDLADWDRGLATSAPGQSGQPGSPHYGDLAPLWADARYFPLAYSRGKVEEVTTHRLWLRSGK